MGDLLFEYNFQSGTASIAMATWTGSTWSAETTLASNIAEAAVFGGTSTLDDIKPSNGIDPATEEFGEAGIDLTAATAGLSGGRGCEQFGRATGESRTSGSSTSAQMKDIVGPANIDISNCVTPLIVTTQQPPSGAIGATYKDKATLSGGNNYDGTGSLTFTLYPNADCTGTPLDTETVSNITTDGDYTTPNGVQLNNAGTYYWVASFSGDGFNNQSSSGCADEPVVVAKNAPTIATLLSDLGPIAIGGSVHDSATLTGATADAGGSVKYAFYSSLSGCNAGTFARRAAPAWAR